MALQGNHFLQEAQIERLRPRVTFSLTNIWEIKRTDGYVIRMATTDKDVYFEGHWFKAAGPNPSDMEQGEALAETDFDIAGILDHKNITAQDLYANKYDNAKLTHWVVDLERPWMWFRKHVWWIKRTIMSDGMFKAEVAGAERFLTVPLGRKYERDCDKVLGSLECGAQVVSFTRLVSEVPSTATGGVISGSVRDTSAFTVPVESGFPMVDLSPDPDTIPIWAFGKVEFLTGANEGQTLQIGYEVGAAVEGSDMSITLAYPAEYNIRVGDQVRVTAGCDGTLQTCSNIFNNRINFGGQPLMPDTSQLYESPQQADAVEFNNV